MRRCGVIAVIVFFTATPLFPASIQVSGTTIDPAANQHITVLGVGAGNIAGLNLYVTATGAPVKITGVDLLTSTVWSSNNSGQSTAVYPDTATYQLSVGTVTTSSGTVAAAGLLAVLTLDATGLDGQTATLTPVYSDGGDTPSDFGGVVPDSLIAGTITIRNLTPPANNPPVVNAGTDRTVNSGAVVQLLGTASDPESAPLTLSWSQVAGDSVTLTGATTLSPQFTAPTVMADTVLEFELSVSDGTSTRKDTVIVTVLGVPPPPVNLPPVVNAGADQIVTSGATVQLFARASDPEHAAMTYQWTQTSGPGVTLSNTAILTPSFTAPAVTASTALAFQFSASDGTQASTGNMTVTVTAPPAQPPTGGTTPPSDPPADNPPSSPASDPPSTPSSNPPSGSPPSSDTPTITPPTGGTSTDNPPAGNSSNGTPSGTPSTPSSPGNGTNTTTLSESQQQDQQAGQSAAAPSCGVGVTETAMLTIGGLMTLAFVCIPVGNSRR